MNTGTKIAMIALLIVVFYLIGAFHGIYVCCQDWKSEACERGHANWSVDNNGETTWDWKVAE